MARGAERYGYLSEQVAGEVPCEFAAVQRGQLGLGARGDPIERE